MEKKDLGGLGVEPLPQNYINPFFYPTLHTFSTMRLPQTCHHFIPFKNSTKSHAPINPLCPPGIFFVPLYYQHCSPQT